MKSSGMLFSTVAFGLMASAQPCLAQAAAATSDQSQSQEDDEEAKKKLDEKLAELTATLEELKTGQQAVEVASKGGEAEASLLAGSIVLGAADWISSEIATPAIGKTVILLESDERLSTQVPLQLSMQLRAFVLRLDALSDQLPDNGQKQGEDGGDQPIESAGTGDEAEGGTGAFGVVGQVAALLTTLLDSDDKISPLSLGTLSDATLVKAVAGSTCSNKTCVIPGLIEVYDQGRSPTFKAITALATAIGTLKATKEDPEKKIAAFETDFAAFLTTISTQDDKGNSPYALALRAEKTAGYLMDANGNPAPNVALLRLKVANTNGTLLERKNFWTMFGASKVAISGVAQVEYTLSTADGVLLKSDFAACGTRLTALSKVQRTLGAETKCAKGRTDLLVDQSS